MDIRRTSCHLSIIEMTKGLSDSQTIEVPNAPLLGSSRSAITAETSPKSSASVASIVSVALTLRHLPTWKCHCNTSTSVQPILRLAIHICNTFLPIIQIPSSSFTGINATDLHNLLTSGCQAKSIFQRCFLQNLEICTATCINRCRTEKRSLVSSPQNCDRNAAYRLQIFKRRLELKISPAKPILCILYSLWLSIAARSAAMEASV